MLQELYRIRYKQGHPILIKGTVKQEDTSIEVYVPSILWV